MLTEFPDDWSQSKRAKYRLLKPAFEKFEGGKGILRIQWMRAKEAHFVETENAGFIAEHAKIKVEHQRAEALKMAQETARASALFSFTADPAPRGMRLS